MQTENLKKMRELRIQEKAIKAAIETVKPLAIEEAKQLAPEDGGKFNVEGVGDFILDVNPILEKDPDNKNDTAPDIFTSRDESAVAYRKKALDQKEHKKQSSVLTKAMKAIMDAFPALHPKITPERDDITVKCID